MQTDRSNANILTGGTLLIAVGLITMANHLFRTFGWELSWPLLLIALSLMLFIGMLLGKKQAAWLAILACVLGGIGLGMSFYSLTHHWKMLFYFWTLLICFTGSGIYMMGWKMGIPNQKRSGLRVMEAGLMLFVILGIFFELLFSRMNGLAFPSLLLTIGLCMVLSRLRGFGLKQDLAPKLVSSAHLQ